MDIEAEEVMINALRAAHLPLRIIAEEHGIVDISEHPEYLGMLDGLDGTNRYIAGRGVERYGTMFGMFRTLAPRFDDYQISGIMEHPTGRLYVAERGNGAWVLEGDSRTQLRVSPAASLREARIYVDTYWEVNRRAFSDRLAGHNVEDPRSFATYFSDLISGKADLVCACTRKGNLEPAIGYAFVKEAGGTMLTLEGEAWGDKRYLEFGQEEQIPFIAAASPALAEELLRAIGPPRRY